MNRKKKIFFLNEIQKIEFFYQFFQFFRDFEKISEKAKKSIFWHFSQKLLKHFFSKNIVFCDAEVFSFLEKTIGRMHMVARAKFFYLSSSFDSTYF